MALTTITERGVREGAARYEKRNAPLTEVGVTGTIFSRGFIQESQEYVPDLIWPQSIRTYEKMRRSDGMAKALLRAISLPLRAARWDVEPYDKSPKAAATAELVREGLFNGLSASWKDLVRQVLTCEDFGYSVFEHVFEVRKVDGKQKVMPRKVSPRLQRTIYRWNMERDGGLTSVTQIAWQQDVGSQQIDIPIEKLLVFSPEKEGANWRGTSVLRPAYKHWYVKDQLIRISAMAAERHGVGVPTVWLPPGQNDDKNIRAAETILANLRSHESGYIVWPGLDYKFEITGIGGTGGRPMDLMPLLEYHDRQMAISILAQFLTLGATEVGSWALSNDQSALFLMVEQALGDYVCDIFNRHLIPQWVDFNESSVPGYPKLIVSNIETRNIEKLLTAIAAATAAGLLTYDPDLEDALREGLGFPAKPETPDEPVQPLGPLDTTAPDYTPVPVVSTQPDATGAKPSVSPPPSPGGRGPAPAGPRPQASTGAESNPSRPVRANAAERPTEGRDRDPDAAADPVSKVKAKRDVDPAATFEQESAVIAGNRMSADAQMPHPFTQAKWTSHAGQPRCYLCGNTPPESGVCEGRPSGLMYSFMPRRPITDRERVLDLERLDSTITGARDKITNALSPTMAKIVRALAEKAAEAVGRGNITGLREPLPAKFEDEIRAALGEELSSLYAFGQDSVRGEILSQIADLRSKQEVLAGQKIKEHTRVVRDPETRQITETIKTYERVADGEEEEEKEPEGGTAAE